MRSRSVSVRDSVGKFIGRLHVLKDDIDGGDLQQMEMKQQPKERSISAPEGSVSEQRRSEPGSRSQC